MAAARVAGSSYRLSHIASQAHSRSPWTHWVNHRIAVPFVWLFARLGIGPNVVTLLSGTVLIGSAAAVMLSHGALWSMLAFLVLSQVGYSFDCADGMLSRLTGTSSRFGGWLDLTLDRLVHVAVLCLLMLAFLPAGARGGEVVRYLAPYTTLLVFSLAYHNGTNLRTLMFARSPSSEGVTARAKNVLKSVITASSDFGFFLFALSLGMLFGVLGWVAWALSALHALALVALIIRVRQLPAEASPAS